MSQPSFHRLPDLFGAAFEADDPTVHAKSHEKAHVDSIQRALVALGRADLDALMLDFAPNVELEIHCPDFFPFTRRARGVDEVRAAIAHNFSTVEDQTPAFLHVVGQGNIIDVTLQETGRVKEAGFSYDVIGFQQFIFQNGKIIRFRAVFSARTP